LSGDDRGEYVLTSNHGVCGRVTFELSGFVPEGFTRPGGDVLDVALRIGEVGEIASTPSCGGHFALLAMSDRPEGELSICARGKGEQAGAGCATFVATKESIQAGVRIRRSR
jgi:hypothetical protein